MTGFVLLKTFSVFMLVLLLIYFVFVLGKKKLGAVQNNSGARIRILEHRRVDQRTSITLFTIDEQTFFLAQNGAALETKAITLPTQPDLTSRSFSISREAANTMNTRTSC